MEMDNSDTSYTDNRNMDSDNSFKDDFMDSNFQVETEYPIAKNSDPYMDTSFDNDSEDQSNLWDQIQNELRNLLISLYNGQK